MHMHMCMCMYMLHFHKAVTRRTLLYRLYRLYTLRHMMKVVEGEAVANEAHDSAPTTG